MRRDGTAFPVGLYGIMLVALCCLTVPGLLQPLERLAVGAGLLVPGLAWSAIGAVPAAPQADVQTRAHELMGDLQARLAEQDVGAARALVPTHWQPRPTRVASSFGRGGGGMVDQLLLAASYREVADCGRYVTKADVLLGTLLRPGEPGAETDQPSDRARVLLLNHKRATAVHAETRTKDGMLALVLGPASIVDPGALRSELWSHPFAASQLRLSGQPVHVAPLPHAGEQPPAGLWLGRTMVWGYSGVGAAPTVTIGVYVQPPFLTNALAEVVLWRSQPVLEEPLPVRTAGTVGVLRPWPFHGSDRALLHSEQPVPDGALVLQDGVYVGRVRQLAFGMHWVESELVPGARLPLLLLPHAANERVRELLAEVVRVQADGITLRCVADAYLREHDALASGYLFTSSRTAASWHAPVMPVMGQFLIGAATPLAADELLLRCLVQPGCQTVTLLSEVDA